MDINEEYLSLFGTEEHPTLYASDDVEYNALRQTIIDAPREFNIKKSLPFEDIQLLSYEEFLKKEIVKVAEKKGFRIFYIKKHEQGKMTYFAAGYYNAENSKFVVLARTNFKKSNYFTTLANSIQDIRQRMIFLNSFRFDGNQIIQTKDVVYDSASLAASYILGRKRSFTIWRDDRGRTLDAYYPMYKSKDISEREERTFPNYSLEVSERPATTLVNTFNAISTILNASDNAKNENNNTPLDTHRIFHIKIEGTCDVSGHYVESSKSFIVLQGSRFKNNTSTFFDKTPLGISRIKFIEAACITQYSKDVLEWVVRYDTSCKSASAAASYILGRVSSYIYWKDENGKSLKSWYPNDFIKSEVHENEKAEKKQKESKDKKNNNHYS